MITPKQELSDIYTKCLDDFLKERGDYSTALDNLLFEKGVTKQTNQLYTWLMKKQISIELIDKISETIGYDLLTYTLEKQNSGIIRIAIIFDFLVSVGLENEFGDASIYNLFMEERKKDYERRQKSMKLEWSN